MYFLDRKQIILPGVEGVLLLNSRGKTFVQAEGKWDHGDKITVLDLVARWRQS